MNDVDRLRRRATEIMREALPLLNETGDSAARLHLQMAIEATARASSKEAGAPLQRDDRCSIDPVEGSPKLSDPDLVRAIGGALAVFAAVMARRGVAAVAEISDAISYYAAVASETSTNEGHIVGCWGAMLCDIVGDNTQDGVDRSE